MISRALVLLASLAICSCGASNSQDKAASFVARSDPYVEALDAVFNVKGCQNDQDERVIATLDGLKGAERLAASRGLQRYSERAHHTFKVSISDVLRALCHPDFDTALRDANTKIELLRVHLERVAPTDRVNQ